MADSEEGKTQPFAAGDLPSVRPEPELPPALPKSVRFHFIKSNHFRVIFCDGVTGGLAPGGDFIRMSVFSTRVPIPVQTVQEVAGPEGLGRQTENVAKEGFVREVEAEIVMDEGAARLISAWLNDRVAEAEKRRQLMARLLGSLPMGKTEERQ